MGTHQPAAPIHPLARRAASLIMVGALPLSVAVIGAVPAAADPFTQTPYGPALVADSAIPIATPANPGADAPIAAAALTAPIADASILAAILAMPGVAPLMRIAAPAISVVDPTPPIADAVPLSEMPIANPSTIDRTAAGRPIADQATAGAETQAPIRPGPAPIMLPENIIRIGNLQLDRPDWLSPEQSAQINDAAAGTESALAQGLTAAGVEPSRSQQVASAVIGDATVGAAVGATVASPIAATGAVIGVVAGLVAGLLFAPAGLVVVPVIGAALGYAMVAAPFAAVGAAAGAAVGVIDGALAPPIPAEPPTP